MICVKCSLLNRTMSIKPWVRFGHRWVARGVRFTSFVARLVLSAGRGDLEVLEVLVETEWALDKALFALNRDM